MQENLIEKTGLARKYEWNCLYWYLEPVLTYLLHLTQWMEISPLMFFLWDPWWTVLCALHLPEPEPSLWSVSHMRVKAGFCCYRDWPCFPFFRYDRPWAWIRVHRSCQSCGRVITRSLYILSALLKIKNNGFFSHCLYAPWETIDVHWPIHEARCSWYCKTS